MMLSLLKLEYEHLFSRCVINKSFVSKVDAIVDGIERNHLRYQTVSENTGVPWFFVGIIHYMECSCNFTTHLCNNDSLQKQTINSPKGYPRKGQAPFIWEYSAEDAIRLVGWDRYKDWSVSGTLFQFEKYNGFGYRNTDVNSPYLWNFSNHYTPLFSSIRADCQSDRCGAAVILWRMFERGLFIFESIDIFLRLKILSAEISFSIENFSPQVVEMQQLLNYLGEKVLIDGIPGRQTSDAYCKLFGSFLRFDPHSN